MSTRIPIQKTDLRAVLRRLNPAMRKLGGNRCPDYMRRAVGVFGSQLPELILCGQLAIWLYQLLYCGGLPIVSCLLALLGGEKLAVGLYQLLQCGGLPAADCLSLGRGKLSVGDTSCFSAACCL